MLQELSMVEQRYLAVREVLDGAKVTDVATRYGVDRRTVHRWLVRYANEGLGALADRSSRPDRCPHQVASEIEARIVALRRAHPGWGPRTILSRLRRELEQPPSRSSIYRCLLRHRMIDHKPRRRRPQDYRRWERSRPMELWQMDVMGKVMLADGTELKAITGIDDHSRYCVIAKVVRRATARPVCEALVEALSRHGVPEQILTDNGKVFTGRLAHKPATVAFDRLCHANGIRHILTAPYSPTTTGKIERLHKTIRKELLSDRTFTTIDQAQAELDAWVARYNGEREHQAIGDVPPARRVLSPRGAGSDLPAPNNRKRRVATTHGRGTSTRSRSPISRTTLAGTPAATTPRGRSRVTTAPAPTTVPCPIVTPGQTMTPPPSHTLSARVIGRPYSQPTRRGSGSIGWVAVSSCTRVAI
jgi:transposase InsO family protein